MTKIVGIVLVLIACLPAATHAAQRNPIAAPTTSVEIQRLPTLHPEAQALEDFLARNVPGWMSASDVRGMAVVIVKNGDVMLARGFGEVNRGVAVDPARTQFHLGSLWQLFVDAAVLQLVEHGYLLLDQDVGAALGEQDRNVTIADILTRQRETEPGLAGKIIERAIGISAQSYVQRQILVPLGMNRSGFHEGGFHVTSNDMARLMLALLGGDTAPSFLQEATRNEMLHVRGVPHAGLAGYALGFGELQKNGWRGFARDGEAPFAQARLVLTPEAGAGYFIALVGHAPPAFWRQIDDALFSRLFSPRLIEELAVSASPAPTPDVAKEVAGTYRIAIRSPYDFLRSGDDTLHIEARGAHLIASGAENGELRPYAGGIWRTEDGNLRIATAGGRLLVDTRVYERSRVPPMLVVLGALVALAAIGYSAYRIWRA